MEHETALSTTPDIIKVGCRNRHCGWNGREPETLKAPHPWIEGETLMGCPACKDTDSLYAICDEAGCLKEVSCGWPSENGCRQTCGSHMRHHSASSEQS